MKKKTAYLVLAALIAAGAAAVYPILAQTVAPTCDIVAGQRILGYLGGPGSDVYLASKDNVENDISLQAIRLRGLGANFYGTDNYGVNSNYRMTAASADFNLDGLDDLVQGGRGTDNNAIRRRDTNLSIHISEGAHPVDPQRFQFKNPIYVNYLPTIAGGTYEMMGLGAGDLDKDGDPDIVALDWRGVTWVFWNRFVENGQAPGADPVIDSVPTPILGTVAASDVINDGYGEYGSNSAYWRWETNIAVADFDNDTDLDVFIAVPTYRAITRYGEVVILVNDGTGHFSRLITKPAKYINPYPNAGLPNGIYGACGIATGDYNSDNKLDFIVCSVSDKTGANPDSRMYYYAGDGLGGFTQDSKKTVAFTFVNSYGYPNFLRGADLDSDGDRDFVMATDGYLSSPLWQGGYVNWYRNEGNGTFTKMPIPTSGAKVSSSGDMDSGAVGDFDGDGDPDFFVADGNDSQQLLFLQEQHLPDLRPDGAWSGRGTAWTAASSIRTPPSSRPRSGSARPSPPGPPSAYYLSNSNDEAGVPKWEGPVTPGVEWSFTAPGNFLRWRAVLESTNNLVTPNVRRVDLDYKYLTKREYSRTSQTLALVDIGGTSEKEEILYSAGFEFPKWRGHLRSWDVSNLNLSYTRASEIQDIKSVNAVYVRDAGEDAGRQVLGGPEDLHGLRGRRRRQVQRPDPVHGLRDRDPRRLSRPGPGQPRGRPAHPVRPGLRHLERPGAAVEARRHQPLLAAGAPARRDDNPVRMGARLRGLHERPTPTGPRSSSSAPTTACSTASTPSRWTELWGFIPNNLLSKLKRMRVIDPDCGEYVTTSSSSTGRRPSATSSSTATGTPSSSAARAPAGAATTCAITSALDVTDPLDPATALGVHGRRDHRRDLVDPGDRPHLHRPVGRLLRFGLRQRQHRGRRQPVLCRRHRDGPAISTLELSENNESSPFGIQNTLPGGPALVDLNSDGYVDALFIGDLHGRIWRIDLSGAVGGWDPEIIYSDPYSTPIITKPADRRQHLRTVARLYFGTGGDEAAPNNGYYSFVSLRSAATGEATVDWYLGQPDLAAQLGIAGSYCKGALGQGEKVWADPVVANHVVYIATLFYSIENLNPCMTLTGSGKIYARFTIGDKVGSSALLGHEGQAIESMYTKQKVRSAVVLGETQSVEQSGQAISKQKVFIQDYTAPFGEGPEPPSEVLAISVQASRLIIKSWREIYRIIR